MNIYRVRYQTSEIFYIQAKDFAEAVCQAIRLKPAEPALVEYLGPIRVV